MSVRSLYVLEGGERDPSRWLDIVPSDQGECLVRMHDLVHPGMPSSFQSFRCTTAMLREVAKGGFVQVRSAEGYCVLRGKEGAIEISFEGEGDGGRTTCLISAEDLTQCLDAIGDGSRQVSLR